MAEPIISDLAHRTRFSVLNKKMNTVQPLFPHLPERLAGLEELAENLWWSWNPCARMLFKTLDRQAWKSSI
jgi:starch phosphorylase